MPHREYFMAAIAYLASRRIRFWRGAVGTFLLTGNDFKMQHIECFSENHSDEFIPSQTF